MASIKMTRLPSISPSITREKRDRKRAREAKYLGEFFPPLSRGPENFLFLTVLGHATNVTEAEIIQMSFQLVIFRERSKLNGLHSA